MLRSLFMAACSLLLCLALSSCTSFNPSATDLMRPPRLTPEQKAIDDALRASVISDPIMKYPQSGDYRSSFVFHDFDGDGTEEALAFYSVDSSVYARVALLDYSNGRWSAAYELPGTDQDVEFVAFANITDHTKEDIVIGWSNPVDADMTLGVYRYEDGKLVKLLKESADTIYNSYLIDDLDKDGLDDIFLFTRNAGSRAKSSWIRQISFDGYTLDTVSSLPLSDSITDFAGITAGRLSKKDAQRAIFIDELLSDESMVTEVFTMKNGMLTSIIEQGMEPPYAEDGAEAPAESDLLMQEMTLYEQTRRWDTTSVCTDINRDTVIEIPTGEPMPGYESDEIYNEDRIYLTRYNQLIDHALVSVFSAAINYTAGYRIEIPEAWIDQVTIVNQPENGEWRFIAYNSELEKPLEDLSRELARIRVVSQKDYQDQFLDNYFQLSPPRGLFSYYGYLPAQPNEPLSITEDELKNDLFALI